MVTHNVAIRHALAKRMDHLKVLPALTFVQAEVGVAVDVMDLIDRVAKGGYKRDDLDDVFHRTIDFDDDGADDDQWMMEGDDDYDDNDDELDDDDG